MSSRYTLFRLQEHLLLPFLQFNPRFAPVKTRRLFYRNVGGTNFIVTELINDEPATVANGSTVAFSCNSPEQVQKFHDVAIVNGGTSIEDLPGPLESAMGTIHLTYVRDPDGNKLCGIYIPE